MSTNDNARNAPVNANPAAPAASPAAAPVAAPVITSVTNTKVNAEVQYQTLVTGMAALFADVTTFALASGDYTKDALVQTFQKRIAAAETSKASKVQWHEDVAAERQVDAEVAPLRKQVKAYAVARFGAESPKLQQLGFTPAKPRKTSAKTKAAAAAKAKATRAALGTKGSRQKKAAKQALAAGAAAVIPPPAPAAAPSPAPTDHGPSPAIPKA